MCDTETGTIKWFNSVSGVGVISPDSSYRVEDDVLFYDAYIDLPIQDIVMGTRVEYHVKHGRKGAMAVNIRVLPR